MPQPLPAPMGRFRLRALLLAAFAASALSACGPSGGAPEAAPQIGAIPVTRASVTREEVRTPILATGNITPAMTTDLGPSVDGIVEEVMVEVGDRVTAGQALFRTRDVDYRLRVQELEGRVAVARAENTAAQRQLARIAQLSKQGVASAGRLDDVQARAKAAEAQMKVAEAQLATAQQQLRDTVVSAPYDAVVTRRDIDPGKFMGTRVPGSGGGVLQIMKIDTVQAIVQVPDANLPQLALGLPARVTADGLDRSFEATVDVINYRVDSATRGVEVRLAIANPEYLIRPGLFARAEILPPSRTALTLQRAAVLGPAGARYVFREAEGAARRQDIETRDLDAERVEILAGLAEGDAVLSGPNLRQLFDGAPVTFLTAAGEQRAAAVAP